MRLYDKQVDITCSVRDNDKTVVSAGNMLGKDYIAAFIAVWFFCSRRPVKVLTTSVDHDQLKTVLWGEIRRFIQTSRYPLPIKQNDLELRQRLPNGDLDPLSVMFGRVAKKGEGMLGQHIASLDGLPHTLIIFDEASGIEQEHYEKAETWAQRVLAIGNPYACENDFKHSIKRGDIPRDGRDGYYVKTFKLGALDSPNVRLSLAQEAAGQVPTREILIPGVIGIDEYRKRRKLWDKTRQIVSLDGEFDESSQIYLYPSLWLDRAEKIAERLVGKPRTAKTMGVDTGEGSANTSWTIIDEFGIIEQRSKKTPNTMEIPGITIVLMRKYNLKPEDILFDRGGGGKQIADYLREQGYNVRTISFGDPATPNADAGRPPAYPSTQKVREQKEVRSIFKNRRAEMYGILSEMMDPMVAAKEDEEGNDDQGLLDGSKILYTERRGFGIPDSLIELRRQLSLMPKLYDGEGKLYMLPKNKKDPKSTEITLNEILGCSPDEADSLVLAVFGMEHKPVRQTIKSMF